MSGRADLRGWWEKDISYHLWVLRTGGGRTAMSGRYKLT